jgi:DNA-binding transcriptional LysR family regulator
VRTKSRVRDWSDIQYVIATAKLGSFQAAAAAVGANPSTVGRRVVRFEANLGTKLFVRHATGMRLTDAGQLLYQKAQRMDEAASDIDSSLRDLDSGLSGKVRIFATEGLAYHWLISVLAEFCRMHPAVQIDLVTRREWLDLFSLETDLALFIERPKNPRVIAAKTVRVEHSLFLSNAYEERHGRPRRIDDLANHQFVDYAPYHVCADVGWWTRNVVARHRIPMVVDSAAVYLAALRAGVGIGLLPNFYKRAAPDLTALPIPTGCSVSLWLVSHPFAHKVQRTRILLKFLRDRFSKDTTDWFSK